MMGNHVHLHPLLLFAVVWLSFFPAPVAAVDGAPVSRAPIRSAAEIDYPPFSLVDKNGIADGFAVELLRAALAAIDRKVDFRTGPWSEVRTLLEKGEIEALPLVGRTPEREELFDFTFPYMSLHGAIVVRSGEERINTIADLKGKRAAVMLGDNAEEFLRRQERGIDIITTPTFKDALQLLSQGNCDAVIVQHLVALRLLGESPSANLSIVRTPIEGFRQDFCFAVREGDRETLALLNEGLALVMADGTYRRLHSKWFAAMQLPADRPVIIGGDHNYPPFEFLDDNGRPTGFTVELTRAIAREMNMPVQIHLGPWIKVANGLRRGEIDAIQGIFYSRERDRVFDFSPFHLVAQFASVTRRADGHQPESLADLRPMRLVAQRGDIILDLLAEHDLDEGLLLVETQEEVLQAVATGQADCALLPRANSLYLIKEKGWSSLVTGRHTFFNGEYAYAVPNGSAALLAQFSEGLRILQENGEYRRIQEKWLGLYEQPDSDLGRILRAIALVALPLLALLAIFALWSWSLRRQVARKTTELLKSEEYQRAMISCSPIALYSIDSERRVQTWNSSAERIFGWTAAEITGKTLPQLPADQDAEFKKLLSQVLAGRSFFALDVVRQRRDGSLFAGSLSLAPIREPDGTIVGIMGAMEDISERKKAQLSIEHLNRVLRTIRDVNQLIVRERDRKALIREGCRLLVSNRGYLSAMIILVDARRQPVAWAMEGLAAQSEKLTAMLGRGEFPPCCRFTDWVDGMLLVDERPTICGDCPIAPACTGSQSMVAPLAHGKVTWGYLIAAAEPHLPIDEAERNLFTELAGDFAYALSVIEIEAVHRQSEEALRQSESRFRLFAELAPVGIVISDQEERTLFASAKFSELFGYTIADIPSVNEWWQLAYPDESFREEVRRQWRQVVDEARKGSRESHPMEFPVTCKDGSVRPVEFRMATTGNLTVVVLADVSERKQAEEERQRLNSQLTQAQKMESVGRLAGGVAHDYNNMLSVIIGYTELALGRTGPDETLARELGEILTAAQRARDITRQLLAFARKQTIAPKVLNLNDTVEGMLRMLRRLIGEDIDLSWRPGAALWAINIDPSQLDQLLANLCVNARDAITDVGKLTIETKNIQVGQEYCTGHFDCAPGEYVLLAVSDTGSGMDRVTLDNLFEPFFTTKDLGKGTGLGLATVYGIVKQNNGFINVYSEPGKGSAFNIYLPRHSGGRHQAELEIEGVTATPQGTGETVLVAEDEAAILRITGKMLANLGYTVLKAITPNEALALGREHGEKIDLLITDVVMPEMNGSDLAAALLPLCPTMKVLYMSGYTADVIAHRGVLDADVNFIQKPFSSHDLGCMVAETLLGDRAQPGTAATVTDPA